MMRSTETAIAGIQPTGSLHIGNYLGAIAPVVDVQARLELLLFIADLHAMTTHVGDEDIRENSLVVAATCMACGADPVSLFIQSDVPFHTELCWLLSCIAGFGQLSRMTQFKDKSQKGGANATLGLFAYPVLMAADILLYRSNYVVVGDDQKQHLEFARDLALSFNVKCGSDVLVVPEPLIVGKVTRVMSLQDGAKKMSKSDPSDLSRVSLSDSEDQIIKKVKRAKTDSIASMGGDLSDRPEVCNLLAIFCALSGETRDQVVKRYEGSGFALFKQDMGDLLVSVLSPIRKRAEELLSDRGELARILRDNAAKASAVAECHMQAIKRAIKVI